MKPTTRAYVIGLAAVLIGLPLTGWAFFIHRMVPDGHADFRANYSAGYMLRTGKPLYDPAAELEAQNRAVSPSPIALPFVHPAYEAILYAPLSLLSFQRAYWVFFALNILLLIAVYRLLPELQVLKEVAWWMPGAALAAFLPFGAALVTGQDSILFVLLLVLAFYFLRDERLFVAGLVLGAGVFRFQLLLPMVACFILWRKWKLIAGFAVTASIASGLSAALADPRRYLAVLTSFRDESSTIALQAPLSHMPNWCGLIRSWGGSDGLVLLTSALTLLIAVIVGRGRPLLQQFAVAITVAVLTSYHLLIHDLSILFIPLAILITEGSLAVVAIGFVAPALMIFSPEHFYLAIVEPAALLLWLTRTQTNLPKPLVDLAPVANPYS